MHYMVEIGVLSYLCMRYFLVIFARYIPFIGYFLCIPMVFDICHTGYCIWDFVQKLGTLGLFAEIFYESLKHIRSENTMSSFISYKHNQLHNVTKLLCFVLDQWLALWYLVLWINHSLETNFWSTLVLYVWHGGVILSGDHFTNMDQNFNPSTDK